MRKKSQQHRRRQVATERDSLVAPGTRQTAKNRAPSTARQRAAPPTPPTSPQRAIGNDRSYAISSWQNSLNGSGFAVQYFPAYEHDFDGGLHSHDTVEVCYVFAGEGTHRHGPDAYPLSAGSLAVMHYGQPHDIDTGGGSMSVINLYLDLARFDLPDLGEELAPALLRILPRHPSLRHQRNRFVHLHFPPGGDHERWLWEMVREQEGAAPGFREAMRSLLRMFLIQCARAWLAAEAAGRERDAVREPVRDDLRDVANPERGTAALRLERMCRAIDADPAAAVSLTALAAGAGWSRSHLCRAFHRHAGMTLGAYVQKARIALAMERLRATRDGVMEVAIGCGFNDPSYFNRAFRAVAGVSPGRYRKQVGQGL
jgi:AraC-like DNA-binding protein